MGRRGRRLCLRACRHVSLRRRPSWFGRGAACALDLVSGSSRGTFSLACSTRKQAYILASATVARFETSRCAAFGALGIALSFRLASFRRLLCFRCQGASIGRSGGISAAVGSQLTQVRAPSCQHTCFSSQVIRRLNSVITRLRPSCSILTIILRPPLEPEAPSIEVSTVRKSWWPRLPCETRSPGLEIQAQFARRGVQARPARELLML